jgi:hypothetical protein
MQALRFLASVFVVLAALGMFPADGSAMTVGEKAAIQAAMQRFIDNQSVGGVYLYLDAKAGEVRGISPVTTHPMIMRMGEHFVLCFTFRDAAGSDVNVDFYLARKGDEYVVFHTAVNDSELLDGLMQDGKISSAD